jgi:hypothetical protein
MCQFLEDRLMAILGAVVNLRTFNSEDSGTDDEIYIGFWGPEGVGNSRYRR